jgi:hypothetical protein
MKNRVYLWRAALCCLFTLGAVSATHAAPAFNVTVGTTGVGIEWEQPLHPRLSVRAVASYAQLDRDDEGGDIDYSAELTAGGAAVLLDWHPFAGAFRVSGGLMASALGLELESKARGEYEIGDRTYSSSDLRLDGDVEYAPVAPYVGIGWGRRADASGWSMTAELGVLLVGDPSLTLDASGHVSAADINGGSAVDVGSSADFQQDLERERIELEDDIDDFSIYPVLNLGVSYAF